MTTDVVPGDTGMPRMLLPAMLKYMDKNRVAVPPMVCFHWFDDNGHVTDRNQQHYHDIAAGGAGLIIGEAIAVTKLGRLHATELGLWEDAQIEGWKRRKICGDMKPASGKID